MLSSRKFLWIISVFTFASFEIFLFRIAEKIVSKASSLLLVLHFIFGFPFVRIEWNVWISIVRFFHSQLFLPCSILISRNCSAIYLCRFLPNAINRNSQSARNGWRECMPACRRRALVHNKTKLHWIKVTTKSKTKEMNRLLGVLSAKQKENRVKRKKG